MLHRHSTRRQFLASCAALAAAFGAPALLAAADVVGPEGVGPNGCGHAGVRRLGPHPVPRPGIDASRVLERRALTHAPESAPAFEMVRAIPRVIDGIRCHCGCAEDPESYSLLSCYEGDGMAQHCLICQGQVRLAFSMHRSGKSLDQIRAAVDAAHRQASP